MRIDFCDDEMPEVLSPCELCSWSEEPRLCEGCLWEAGAIYDPWTGLWIPETPAVPDPIEELDNAPQHVLDPLWDSDELDLCTIEED